MKKGIYYYLWGSGRLKNGRSPEHVSQHEETANFPLIGQELEDIRNNLLCDFIVLDLMPSLFEYYKGWMAGYNFVLQKSSEIGLEVLPILSFGAGMLTHKFFDENPDCVALDDKWQPVPFADSWWMSYYAPRCLEELRHHCKTILDIHCKSKAALTLKGKYVIEVMEDVGYPDTIPTDYHPLATFPKERAVTNFIKSLADYCHSLFQTLCLYHAYRSGRPFHTQLAYMGLNYYDLSNNTDGQLDTVAPLSFFPGGGSDYQVFRHGVSFMADCNQNGIYLPVVSCDRAIFDVQAQIDIILSLGRSPAAIVYYPYNEGCNTETDIQAMPKFRDAIRTVNERN